MPGPDRLAVLLCEGLFPTAVELVAAGRFDDVRLISFPGECARHSCGWQNVERAAAAAGDCQQFRVLAGECLPDSDPVDANGRPISVIRRCEGLPAALSASGRERLVLLGEKVVLEWRLESQRARLNAMLASAYRRLTDSQMVEALVSGLADTLAEEKVVSKVFDLFATMLAPATMVFLALEDGRPQRIWSQPAGFGESEEVRQRLASFSRAYDWTESGAGFRVSLRHRTKNLGVLEVEGVSFPEHRDHYLDMALVVARASALAIADARLYRELKGPNRSYLEFAEDLRGALDARKRAEERQAQLLKQVEAANQELADFAHVVSHDLKAPLRAIDSLAKWLAADYEEKFDDDGRKQLDLLLGRVKRMHDLIDGILQYSRAGRTREQVVEVDTAELVPEVIDLLSPPPHIRVAIKTRLPKVNIERTRISQVLQNLLSNAIKYMDKPEGLIEVGCTEEGGFWKFFVRDNGPGIEEKDRDRVFQLFQTLKPRDQSDSTGVGLAVVKKSVELYGGRVWIESQVGKGSTFYFTLPKPTPAVGA
ncbi:MAG TPA: ATP-binding protein [bacterium]|nr:ATP-binding protein [bacterium]